MKKEIILKQFDKDLKEADIEKYFVNCVKNVGGKAEKFRTPGKRSVPDRLCSFAHGQIIFVELKAPRKKPTVKQYEDHDKRRAMGFEVWVIDTKEKVDIFIEYVIKNILL